MFYYFFAMVVKEYIVFLSVISVFDLEWEEKTRESLF